ncbi:MAG: hypothetical protein R2762_20205 [Bryobacteraceae bacterium]
MTTLFEQYVKLSQNLNYETMIAAIRVGRSGQAGRYRGREPAADDRGKQELLEIFDPVDRLMRVAEMLDIEIEKLNMDLHDPGTREAPDGAGAEGILSQREKIKAIQKELGRGEKSEYDDLKKKIEAAGMTPEAKEKAITELKRLSRCCRRCRRSRRFRAITSNGRWRCRGRRMKEIRDLSFAEKGARAGSPWPREDQRANHRVFRHVCGGW